MNFETIKNGFLNYLTEKLSEQYNENSQNSVSTPPSETSSETSIFEYDDEFKEYLCNVARSLGKIFTEFGNFYGMP